MEIKQQHMYVARLNRIMIVCTSFPQFKLAIQGLNVKFSFYFFLVEKGVN